MIPDPNESSETAELGQWFDEKVLDFDRHNTHLIGEETKLFSSGSEFRTLPQLLLDGFCSQAPEWAGTIHPPSSVLMRAIKNYLDETPSHLAQALYHDGCYWEFRRFFPVHSPDTIPRMFSLLHEEPADEGGSAHIFLLANDRRSAIELLGSRLQISFHGDEERTSAFFHHLSEAAQDTQVSRTSSETLAARQQGDFWTTYIEGNRSNFRGPSETSPLLQWLKETVLASDGCNFHLIGEETIVFEHGYQGTFAEALLDGLASPRPDWTGSIHPPSEVLIRALTSYLPETPSHGVRLLHQNARNWEIHWFQSLGDSYTPIYPIVTLMSHPADDGGCTCLMILADDRQSAIVFANQPGEGPYRKRFTVAFYGDEERKELLLSHLARAAEAPEETKMSDRKQTE